MTCAHAYVPGADTDGLFTVESSAVTFGRGALHELGELVRAQGVTRAALFTDPVVAGLEPVARALRSLRASGVDVAVYDRVRIEPTDGSFLEAARFARDGRFDGYVSVGGGSVMDTCKAAVLYATHPADLLTYVNAPVGAARPVPGALPPHVACPTTSGTGSELTGIAVCDIVALSAKTGIASRYLRPVRAVIDPDATDSLPAGVVAASGFDVLCHAMESYTARSHATRVRAPTAAQRPLSQGANPWSDLGSIEALRITGAYLVRAVTDSTDAEAREQLMWAATLAGIAFGNAGVHLPHAMAYAVAGLVRDFHMPGYPRDTPLIPHGVSVAAGAPAAFRFTAPAHPQRHLTAAGLLGADIRDAAPEDAGAVLADALSSLMKRTRVPVGLSPLGYTHADLAALVNGTAVQKRLLDNAPRGVSRADLAAVFTTALHPERTP